MMLPAAAKLYIRKKAKKYVCIITFFMFIRKALAFLGRVELA